MNNQNKGYKKSKEYKRETACKALEVFLERCISMNEMQTDSENIISYMNVKDVTLFGSLVNSNKTMVHDVDINVVFEKSPLGNSIPHDELLHIAVNLAPSNMNMVLKFYWLTEGCSRYLANKQGILSVNTEDINQLTGRKVKIMENGQILLDNLHQVFAENNYKSTIK